MERVLCVVFVVISFGEDFCYTGKSDSSMIDQKGIRTFEPTNIPPKCEEAGFCTDYVGTYPTDHVQKMLLYYKPFLRQPVESKSKSCSSPGDEGGEVCPSRQEIIQFKVAKSLDNLWYFILNTDSYNQSITVTRCDFEGKPCNHVEDSYVSRCSEGTQLRYLYAVSHTGEIFEDVFSTPSCCTCLIKQKKNVTTESPL